MRPTEAIVDLGAVARNVEQLVNLAAPAKVCAVTKADGYGHGAVAVSRAALDAGASSLAVALVEEGMQLRDSGIRAPILLLSEPRPKEMFEVVSAGLTPTVYTPDGIAALVAAAGFDSSGEPVEAHLNIDTGMNRVGLRPDTDWEHALANPEWLLQVVEAVGRKPEVRLSGVWTHLAVADEVDRPETGEQLTRFDSLLDSLGTGFTESVTVHASNSAGLLGFPAARYDMVRAGIAMYGIAPSQTLAETVELEPALQVQAEVGMVKSVRAGEGVSYGLRHRFSEDTVVATIALGYADGLRRDSYRRGVSVLVGGEFRPLVGTVTMDQCMVDLGPESKVTSGEPVVLIGSQGDRQITAADAAELFETIPYEIVCDIGRRVRRRYI